MHVTLLVQFLDLRGHCGLQTALEVKSDLRYEISDPKNPCDQSFRVHLFVTLGTCQQEREIYLFMTCASAAGKNANLNYISELWYSLVQRGCVEALIS